MASVSIDTSEVRALAADMRQVDERMNRYVLGIVEKGANNIKNQLRAEMSASRHFKGATSAITYDLNLKGFGGGGIIEAEIGPERGRPGSIANIAYFGGSNGGGGTVPDPQGALDAELPNFSRALEELAEWAVLG